jgi:hypothetical protein
MVTGHVYGVNTMAIAGEPFLPVGGRQPSRGRGHDRFDDVLARHHRPTQLTRAFRASPAELAWIVHPKPHPALTALVSSKASAPLFQTSPPDAEGGVPDHRSVGTLILVSACTGGHVTNRQL